MKNMRTTLHEETGAELPEWIAMVAIVLILLLAASSVFSTGGAQIATEVTTAVQSWAARWTGGSGGLPATTNAGNPPANAQPPVNDQPVTTTGPQGNPNPTVGGNPTRTNQEADGGDLFDQIGDFFVGVGEGAWNAVTGIVSLGRDLLVALPGTGALAEWLSPGIRAETFTRYQQMWEAIKADPMSALYAMVEPMVTAWDQGEYGRAIGMGAFEIAMVFVPGDEAGKLGKITAIERVIPDELAALLARIERLTPDELSTLVRNIDQLTPGQLAALQRRLDALTPDELAIVQRRMADTLLGANGHFLDAGLEDAYQAYVKRKQARGELPRERADWKVERDYWLTESPTARGNRFDTIAGDLNYRYNQVHLENGKRLDSYDPSVGEIISRKATDFDIIQESTFRTYLHEIKAKYGEGTRIRSDKYPDLDGQPLRGQYVLEVPDTNLNAATRTQFEQIAREEGILVRYTNETTGEIVHVPNGAIK